MGDVRSDNAMLSDYEIEAIKVTQSIIARMADSSKSVKSIFLLLCAAMISLFGSNLITVTGSMSGGFIALIIAFWVMDARYLQLERRFCEHHKAIISGTTGYLRKWDFDHRKYKTVCLVRAMFSFSEWVYPIVCLVILGLQAASYLPAR